MAIKLDEMKVTQSIGEVKTGFQNVRIENIQCDLGNNTIKIASSLPESMNQLMKSFENVQSFGNKMAENMEMCKNQVVEMDHKLTQEIKVSTMENSGEGN